MADDTYALVAGIRDLAARAERCEMAEQKLVMLEHELEEWRTLAQALGTNATVTELPERHCLQLKVLLDAMMLAHMKTNRDRAEYVAHVCQKMQKDLVREINKRFSK